MDPSRGPAVVGDDFFDAFLLGGYLPQEETVTLVSPKGDVTAPLVARRETTGSEDFKMMAAVYGGVNVATWTFNVGQDDFVYPRLNWTITSSKDGSVWVIKVVGNSVGLRMVPVTCVNQKAAGVVS